MSADEPLSLLLLRWQEIYEREGRDVPPGELCGDRPELEPELRRQIGILKRLDGLADGLRDTGGDDPPSKETQKIQILPADDPAPAAAPAAPGALPAWLRGLLEPPEQPGDVGRLGRYRVLRLLGAGGLGAAVLAEDPGTARRVALKVLKPALAEQPDSRRRFLREARAAAVLVHDHVVPVYHCDEINGVPYLEMPLLQGESLEDRLRREPRPPLSLTLQVGREAAEGLAAAHARDLLHRDVKPGNIWLEALPRPGAVRVRLLDFGLARALEAGDRPGAAASAYVSPERANGEPLRPASDLFSLGAVLYRLAAGRPAFDGPTPAALLRSVAEAHPPLPHHVNPDVPRSLSELILAMLAKDPARRPESARAVADALAAFEPGPSPRAARRGLGRWVTAGVLLAGAVLLAAIVWRNLFP
jgi:hypothetical protein